MTDGRRLRGRAVALGLLALVGLAASAAVFLFFANQRPEGEILARAEVVTGGRVVVRRGSRRGGIFVVRYDAQGGFRWSEALFGVPPDLALVVDAERVYVGALGARGAGALTALDLRDGAFAFRVDAGPGNVRWSRILGPREGAVVGVFGKDEGAEVLIVATADGAERGRATVPVTGAAPELRLDVAGVHVGGHRVSYTGEPGAP